MAATEQDVKDIMSTTLTVEAIAPFLDAARVFIAGALAGQGYTRAELDKYEAWCAAHFLAIRDSQPSAVVIGPAEAKFNGTTGKGFEFTGYGQQLLAMEYKGVLKGLQACDGPVQNVEWLGEEAT